MCILRSQYVSPDYYAKSAAFSQIAAEFQYTVGRGTPAMLANGFQSLGNLWAAGPSCWATNAAADRDSSRSAIARSSFCRRVGLARDAFPPAAVCLKQTGMPSWKLCEQQCGMANSVRAPSKSRCTQAGTCVGMEREQRGVKDAASSLYALPVLRECCEAGDRIGGASA